jgi:hypothetical protein
LSTTLPNNVPCPANSQYRVYVNIKRNSIGTSYLADYAYLKVTWPAAVDPLSTATKPSGSVETVAVFVEK